MPSLPIQIVVQDFHYFEVEISHGRVIVLDKVEGQLMTSPFIEQTFTVQLQRGSLSTNTYVNGIVDRAWHEFFRELTLNSCILHYVSGIFIKCHFYKNVPLTIGAENRIRSARICHVINRGSRLSKYEEHYVQYYEDECRNGLCDFVEQYLQVAILVVRSVWNLDDTLAWIYPLDISFKLS